MTTHGSFPRQIFAGYTPFSVPNFGTKNGRFCWQCLCSSDPYGESMNSNVHKNKRESHSGTNENWSLGWNLIIFFAFLPKNAPRWKNGLFSGRGIGNGPVHLIGNTFRPLGLNCWLEGCQGVKIMFPKDEDQQCIALLKKFTFQIMMLWLKDDWINKCNAAGAAAASSIFPLKKQKLINSRAELEHWTPSFR